MSGADRHHHQPPVGRGDRGRGEAGMGPAAHPDDDYYHYYMASQKRVSRWISQTQRELENATPLLIPDNGPVVERMRETRGSPEKERERERRKEAGRGGERRGGETVGTGSTLVASTSSKGQGRLHDDGLVKRKKTEREKEKSGEKEKEVKRMKSRKDIAAEDVDDGHHGRTKKRTSSMSPPASLRKPISIRNALALELGSFIAPRAETDEATSIAKPYEQMNSDHVGSASDLARLRDKPRDLRHSKDSSPHKPRGREESWTVLERKKAALEDREDAAYRSRSRATTAKRSNKSYSSSNPKSTSPLDFSSTSLQALLVLLSSSMLMIAVAPKAGFIMSAAVAAVMIVVMSMPSDDPPSSKRRRSRSIDSTRMPDTMVNYR